MVDSCLCMYHYLSHNLIYILAVTFHLPKHSKMSTSVKKLEQKLLRIEDKWPTGLGAASQLTWFRRSLLVAHSMVDLGGRAEFEQSRPSERA
jgi:hypothetical protein